MSDDTKDDDTSLVKTIVLDEGALDETKTLEQLAELATDDGDPDYTAAVVLDEDPEGEAGDL